MPNDLKKLLEKYSLEEIVNVLDIKTTTEASGILGKEKSYVRQMILKKKDQFPEGSIVKFDNTWIISEVAIEYLKKQITSNYYASRENEIITGKTQEELAAKLGVSKQYLSNSLNKRRKVKGYYIYRE